MLTDDRRAALADLVHASDAMRAIPAYLLGAALLETLLSIDARLAALLGTADDIAARNEARALAGAPVQMFDKPPKAKA